MSRDYSDKKIEYDRRGVIEEWMRMVLRTGGIERFDHLHIDKIDSEWRSRETWFIGSSEVLELARELRNQTAPDKVLALMCSLTCDASETPPESIAELAEQIDWSPPSLYLFEPGSEPWNQSSAVEVSRLNEIFSGCTSLVLRCAVAGELTPRRSFVSIA